MNGGRIVQYGTYQELLAQGVDFNAELGDGLQTPQQLSPATSLTPANSMPRPGASQRAAQRDAIMMCNVLTCYCAAGFRLLAAGKVCSLSNISSRCDGSR